MKCISYNVKRTFLILMFGLQLLGLTACDTKKSNVKDVVENQDDLTQETQEKRENSKSVIVTNPSSQPEETEYDENDDILQEISFDLPKGLTMDSYNNKIGQAGGCIFQPTAYESGSEILPAEWTASGMVSRYRQQDVLTWNGTMIGDVMYGDNRSIMEFLENINDLAAPAVLIHGNHSLYTAYGLKQLESNGKDLSTVDLTSDYWYLFIAQPDQEYGYVISLNQKNYSKEDMVALGKSIRILNR